MKRKIGWFSVACVFAIFVFNLPFVGEKLLSQQEALVTNDINSTSGIQNRFFSFSLDWQEFLRHPFLGLGCNFKGTWLNQHGYEFITISGLGELLSTYGGLISLLFVIMLIKSSLCFSKDFSIKSGWVLIIVIIGIMISYSLWRDPVFIAFWLYCLWGNNKRKVSSGVQESSV
jgi:hypothetical protein